mgnify:CR=1 FL=1
MLGWIGIDDGVKSLNILVGTIVSVSSVVFSKVENGGPLREIRLDESGTENQRTSRSKRSGL